MATTKDYNSPGFRPTTLVDLLRWRATTQPEQRAFTFLVDGNKKEVRLTYADLDKKARAFAAMLQSKGLAGERALLLYPPGIDYIIAFFGCLYAGVIAVPAYPPDPNRLNRTLPRLQAIVKDAQSIAALTNDTIMYMIKILKLGSKFSDTMERMPVLRKFRTTMNYFSKQTTGIAQADLGTLLWISSDDVVDSLADAWKEPKIGPDSIAFLQYTSGSTGVPKGVMLTHENLLVNSAHIYSAFGYSKNTEGVIWLPIYHDMGLIGGVLQPIYGGMPTTLISPVHFLQRPLRWLEAISRIEGKEIVSGGPNFAYDLCVKKVTPQHLETLDLSNWKVAFSGAEPVRQETIDRFYNTFKDNGFKKSSFLSCYGLAEATLYVTGVSTDIDPPEIFLNRKELQKGKAVEVDQEHPEAKGMVSCGHPPEDQVVAIVNPETFERVKGNDSGEIWVMGPNVAKGYWNREDATKETFQAYIKETNEGPFLRTGDLGYIKDGELFITGRVKDLIIIRGRNYYPQDIEFLVENAHEAIRPGCTAAFSVEEDSEEKLVIVAELRQHKNLPFEEIVAMIRQIITETNDIRVHAIVLIKPRTISKTSSGKIQRHAVKNEYEDGTLKVVHDWKSTATISEASLIEQQVEDEEPEKVSEADYDQDYDESDEDDLPASKGETAMEVERWLIAHLAEALAVDKKEIDIRKPFVSYGLDSAQAIGLVGDLEEHIGRPLSPTIIWDYPNIEKLSLYIEGEGRIRPVKRRTKTAASDNEPIAIIGYSLRMPQARNAEEFWQNLVDGKDCISEVPPTRWNADDFYDPNPGTPAKMITRWGGFLDDVDQFDPQFFGISPREAPHMDPQQRMLLEVSFEALENAGLNMQGVSGSNTGVFIAISGNDYLRLQIGDFKKLDAYSGTGNAFSIAANRLSYIYDFKGPSFIVDTACSSSLVAVHNAVTSLRRGECEMALAGGVNLILAPDVTITFSQARMMSPNGRCKTFDADADGYVRGDGVGVVVLKRLSDALQDGDNIRAVIRGSAINQDGRSNGITAPNGLMQQACIRAALEDANVKPADVGYFETHGTGTSLGDPIETEAMRAVMTEGREEGDQLIIGSVKTNIGHLESAAGISGLLKAIMTLENGQIPKHLHFKTLNPHIKLDEKYIKIATETMPWPTSGKKRIAGVSAYGFGGTNAHIVLEEAPESNRVTERTNTVSGHAHILVMSAHSPEALKEMAAGYHKELSKEKYESDRLYTDFVYSAAVHRGHFDFSATVIATDRKDMLEKLENFATEPPVAGVVKDTAEANPAAKTVFVFSGQGPQWYAMGRQLYKTQPVYRQTVDQIDRMLKEHAPWSLLEELEKPEEASRVSETEIAQPAIFALQVALARLWESWGVRPAAVVGHSVGEIAAAHISGMLTLKDAVKVIYHRGRLMQRATGFGKMASLDLPLDKAKEAIAGHTDKLGIAAHNSPENTVISGEEEALKEVVTKLEKDGVYCKIMRVNYAFHSPHMEPFKQELIDALEGIKPYKARIPIYSTLHGEQAKDNDYDPVYWSNNIREKVSFAEAALKIIEEGYTQFVEIAPHSVLAGSVSQCLRSARKQGLIVNSLKRQEDEQMTMLLAAGALFCRGHQIYWKKIFPAGARFTPLPLYPWQHERYWFDLKGNDPRNAPIFRRSTVHDENGHPLVGSAKEAPLTPGKRFYETVIDTDRLPYLKDHKIQESIVFPATGYIEMALAASGNNGAPLELSDLNFFRAMFLNNDKETPVQVVYSPTTNHSATVQVFSLADSADARSSRSWQMNSMGFLRLLDGENLAETGDKLDDIRKRCNSEMPVNTFFDKMREKGLQYGPSFQGVRAIWQGHKEALAQIRIADELKDQVKEYRLHPALLDSCLQVLSASFRGDEMDSDNSTFMPVSIGRMRLLENSADEVWCHAKLHPNENGRQDSISGDILLYTPDGKVLAELSALKLQRLGQQQQESLGEMLYKVEWQEEPLGTDAEKSLREPATWLLFADKHNMGKSMAERLTQYNQNVITVRPGDQFARIDENLYSVRPQEREDYDALLSALAEAEQPAPGYVISLWPLEAGNNLEIDPEKLAAEHEKIILPSLYLLQAVKQASFKKATTVSFVTEKALVLEGDDFAPGALQSTHWGFGRVAASESQGQRILKIDFSGSEDDAEEKLIAELSSADREDQVAYRGEKRYCARLQRAADALSTEEEAGATMELPDEPHHLQITQPGVLAGLRYQKVERPQPAKGEIEIEVHASGLNFRDVLMALGLYPGGPIPLGSECSGTVTRVGEGVSALKAGDEVMAIAPHTFGKYALTVADLAVKKPANISFDEAATIPITYLTAWYALVYLGRLRKGERVLVHAGAGGVGQAAIRIAQMTGAEVLATAGSAEKHAFLHDMGVKHVFSSRSLDFADDVMAATNGEGVDVVLNSLAGEFIPRSISLLKAYGRFLEIGKTDLFQNSQLDMFPFRKNLSYHAIDLDMVSRDKPSLINELFNDIMENLSAGKLQPLPLTVFDAQNTIDAFRYMAQRRNIGKVVVSMKKSDQAEGIDASAIRNDATYLITGGLGNLGLVLADWLSRKGAGAIVLLSRREIDEATNKQLAAIRERGTQVHIASGDVSDIKQLKAVFKDIEEKLPPLRGVIHSAGLLSDAGISQFNKDSFMAPFAAKVNGSYNLHLFTEKIDLDFFILFSSVAAITGNPGQANYAAANFFMDTLAEMRMKQNLPATSINWGFWENTQMAEDKFSFVPGAGKIAPDKGLAVLEKSITARISRLIASPVNWSKFLMPFPEDAIPPIFTAFSGLRQKASAKKSEDAITQEMLLPLAEEQRMEMMTSYLREKIAAVVGVAATKLETNKPLNTMGLDSLMAIEVKNSVETSLGTHLPIATLLKGPTIEDLAKDMIGQVISDEGEKEEQPVIETSPKDLSHGQQAMWFQHQLNPSSIYNQVYAVRLKQPIDSEVLEQSLEKMSRRHEALRTNFSTENGKPVQIVHDEPQKILHEIDARHMSEEDFRHIFKAESKRAFDLEKDPLTHITLFHMPDGTQVFLYVAHHIISDMWSLAIFMKELNDIYSAGGDPELPPIPHKYSDYVRDMKQMLAGKEGRDHLDFWEEELEGELPVLNLPTDKPRPAVQTYSGLTETLQIDAETTKKLGHIADKNGTTLYALLLAIFKVLLFRYTEQKDIIIGTPTTGRTNPDYAPILGYFVNPAAVRSTLNPEMTFDSYLEKIRDKVINILAHQDYPFNLLVEKLHPRRDPSRTPVFQVMFVYQKAYLLHDSGMSGLAVAEDGGQMKLGDIDLESVSIEDRVVPFDLTMLMAELDDGLGASLQYNTDLFTQSTAKSILEHYAMLARAIADDPQKPVYSYPLLKEEESARLLKEWNDSRIESDLSQPVHRLFEQIAKEMPDKEALVYNGHSLSYKELNENANRLARILQSHSIGPDNIVGISLKRSPQMITAVLAVLKSGAAYLPLDPEYPSERLHFMLQDSGASLLLTSSELKNQFPDTGSMPVLSMDRIESIIGQQEKENLQTAVHDGNLVYVIYTSGSTGRPKGVMLSHRGLNNLVNAQVKEFRITEETRLMQFASLSFDAAASEIFTTLLSGATLVLADTETLKSGPDLVKFINEKRISTATIPPSVLRVLSPQGLDTLQNVISAGESLAVDVAQKWLEGGRHLINAYGPTEATICASCYQVQPDADHSSTMPIGGPIDNVRLYVLDSHMNPVPAGIPGELYIAGAGLARGYLQRPAMTAEKFVPDPFSDEAGARLYRSGDLVRWLRDGNLEFIDRIDQQVKVRGFRIELGEIEAVLKEMEGVRDCIVVARGRGDKRLTAYIISQEGTELKQDDLKYALHHKLPDYMVPAAFMLLEEFPLTRNGKIDMNALPVPEADKAKFVQAQNDTERKLADIWQEVLGLEQVGIFDNFFDLGGHSLNIVQAQGKIKETFDRDVNVVDMFRYPTISAFAKYLSNGSDATEKVKQSEDRASKQREATRMAQKRLRDRRR